MEHIIVRYKEKRGVMVDGLPLGTVDIVLQVNKGRHKIKMDGAQNYTPSFRFPNVQGTTPASPLEVTFE